MLSESELNTRYMPYVSRAKSYGGPTLLQAVGPALLVKNWRDSSTNLRRLLIQRFGRQLALTSIKKSLDDFAASKPDLLQLLTSRYKEVYE